MDILPVGRTPAVIADVLEEVDAPAVSFHAASSFEEADAVLARVRVDHVIVGGGLALDTRLRIVRSVFESSTLTTVHMKPRGPDSYLPFVRAMVRGLGAGR
jgi:hypothetical protein